jgi:hypothetical protein
VGDRSNAAVSRRPPISLDPYRGLHIRRESAGFVQGPLSVARCQPYITIRCPNEANRNGAGAHQLEAHPPGHSAPIKIQMRRGVAPLVYGFVRLLCVCTLLLTHLRACLFATCIARRCQPFTRRPALSHHLGMALASTSSCYNLPPRPRGYGVEVRSLEPTLVRLRWLLRVRRRQRGPLLTHVRACLFATCIDRRCQPLTTATAAGLRESPARGVTDTPRASRVCVFLELTHIPRRGGGDGAASHAACAVQPSPVG